ncbi:Protein NLRC3 [Tetrabaena socialis]|uniref:Protein NLRC3 n=1 Tax=Tetrabaena socialis TaxID=47790 RepID=A0A2J7ZNA1_9CHLO|nr:Protein NLRC3 [Tetrabaena socialis]|eukprot:PNH01754.1 Protein NLRC3 [Tetrabaena socialis]
MSREVLDAQEKYPLADRAISMPALLCMVGKAWPKGRRTDMPSLDSLLDAPNPPRGLDGRLLSDMLVWEVVQHFIQPATEDAHCSYITAFNSGKLKEEHAALLAPTDVYLEYWASGDIQCYKEWLKDPSIEYDYQAAKSYTRQLPSVATTTWFVSHAWSRPWRELVDMVWQHYLRQPLCVLAPGHWNGQREIRIIPVFYWIDIWAVSQHFKGDFTKHPDSDFPAVITAGRGVVLTMAPWASPVTVSRVWCLFEIMQVLKAGKLLEVFPERSFWESDHVMAEESIKQLLSTSVDKLDCSTAQATVEQDRQWIMSSIESEYGIEPFNTALRGPMQDKLLEAIFMRSLKAKNIPALALAERLGAKLTMEILDIGFWHIGPESAGLLGQVLARSPGVREMTLCGNDMEDEGATAIAEAVAANHSLKSADMGSNGITNVGGLAMVEALKLNPNFKVWCTDRNEFEDEVALAVVAAMKEGKKMEVWFSKWNKISEDATCAVETAWLEMRGAHDGLALRT